MKLNRLFQQNVDSDDFYYSLTSICYSKSIQNIGQRLFPFQIIYDYGKHSGMNHDRVCIIQHVNGICTIKSWNSNLTRAQPVHPNISDSDNSGQGFIHECDISLICEWAIDEDSTTEAIESKVFTQKV